MTSSTPVTNQPVKLVKCPTCGSDSVYALNNAFRPFCCERCKQIDLGAWASERFAVPATVSLEDQLIDKN
jgi:endogenous inhibitor of DNA gyrase (YacG/DUF329 family)